tara:strand:+ start:601 stop:1191 length:591 start_codon:yes stop_codon:yes gene_type:complete
MTFEVRAIILIVFVAINVIFLLNKKGLVLSSLHVFLSVIALIWLASETFSSQILIKDFAFYILMLFLFLLSLILVLERGRSDKKEGSLPLFVGRSFGRVALFFVIFAAVISAVLFLIISTPDVGRQINHDNVAKEVDVNNVKLAQGKIKGKSYLLKEDGLMLKILLGLEKVIVMVIVFSSASMLLMYYKDIFIKEE